MNALAGVGELHYWPNNTEIMMLLLQGNMAENDVTINLNHTV